MRRRIVLVLAQSLEQGHNGGLAARVLARAWAPWAARTLVRPLEVPRGVRVVAVGGSTLGGSGKTPVAVACALELAARGARVALVGHAYRASPGAARVVTARDRLADVGDEALVAAQVLEPRGVPVVVAPSRAAAVAFAAGLADVLVLDGTLQIAPVRAALSLLAVDTDEPWGRARSVPPRGDLRAPVEALLAWADAVVAVGEGEVRQGEIGVGARVVSRGVFLGTSLVPWTALAGRRVGLACALARPERVLRFLARRGVVPVAVVRAADHRPLAPGAFRAHADDVDVWVATAKCALHAPPTLPPGRYPPDASPSVAPLGTIEHALVLSPEVCARLALLHACP
jgi:tetraacyldisaccharide 4'-kinase